jgi:hypothetical protein
MKRKRNPFWNGAARPALGSVKLNPLGRLGALVPLSIRIDHLALWRTTRADSRLDEGGNSIALKEETGQNKPEPGKDQKKMK